MHTTSAQSARRMHNATARHETIPYATRLNTTVRFGWQRLAIARTRVAHRALMLTAKTQRFRAVSSTIARVLVEVATRAICSARQSV